MKTIPIRAWVALLVMLLASVAAVALTPKIVESKGRPAFQLDTLVPRQFGDWNEVPSLKQTDLTIQRDPGTSTVLYDQTLMRTYRRNSDGAVIMMALAYGSEQRQDLKLHRPELCYYSQGYQVQNKQFVPLLLAPGLNVNAVTLLTRSPQRIEPVTYWMRVGKGIVRNSTESRIRIFKEGLAGNIPDGLLVRVSSVAADASGVSAGYQTQAEFLQALYGSLPESGKQLFVGNLKQ